MSMKETFGAFTRREREAKQIGLRKMAKMIDVSPTYLSKIERDEFPPPAEDKVKAIAEIIGCNQDHLLARANRVASDIVEVIKSCPVEISALLRDIKELPTKNRYEAIGAMRTFVSFTISAPRDQKEQKKWMEFMQELTKYLDHGRLLRERDEQLDQSELQSVHRRPRN